MFASVALAVAISSTPADRASISAHDTDDRLPSLCLEH